jgi:hypothetical protein
VIDSIVEKLISSMLSGGPHAIIAILMLVIALLLIERKRLIADLSNKDAKIDKIIDDFHKGNITLTEALNSLKIVLFEIKAKL